ncbi:hypothetical protein [Pararhodobacter sp. SW119]|uniref:hypothetical protein n=1 Tax=Pararhodobacter sp. SW119 TaxID=2780075 RepID=UPI001AE0DAB8|nr:hypothetical protein [Pararhodobacter sp. SW119]
MSSEPGSRPGTLRSLGAALLNATLLLLALVLVLAIVLVVQLRGLAQETRLADRPDIATLEDRVAQAQATAQEALATLDALEARRGASSAPPPAPGAIRPAPTESDLPDDLQAVERALMSLAAELAALRIAPLDPDALERDDDSLIRWLVLVILRTIARDFVEPGA